MKRLIIFAIVGLMFCAVQIDPAQAIEYYSLGDRVWYDQDQDGIQDTSEPGYNGITVELYDNATCSGTPMASTTSGATGPAGFYQFTDLTAGGYCIQFANIPAGWSISPANQGADDAFDSDANSSAQIPNISLSVNDDTQDMGIYVSGSLGDSVLCDSTALANITVELFEDFNVDGVADGPAIATTETDSSGFYQFTGLEVALAGDTSNTTAYILRVDVNDADLGSCNVLSSSGEFNPQLDSDNPDDQNNDFIFAEEPPTVGIDIKPQSCPNPFNFKSQGKLPVAILGTDVFDVSEIDVSTILLEGVPPLRWSYEDVASAYADSNTVPLCPCNEDGPDGYIDLTLKFDTQAIAAAIGDSLGSGDIIQLYLTGNLLEDGTPIEGTDCVVIVGSQVDFSLQKVTVCHRGSKTISVGTGAVPAHLRHGDTLGPCP